MYDLAVAGHLALAPQAHVLAARVRVEVAALPVAQVLLPLSLVPVAVDVAVDAEALAHILHPAALVLGAVQVNESALAVLLVTPILANVPFFLIHIYNFY